MCVQYEISVIIPTYNEQDNIADIIKAVDSAFSVNKIHGEIIVVDDKSRDETIEIVQCLTIKNNNLRLIVRPEDHGLSQSILEGFKHADSNIFMVIDADFSHPPILIPQFYSKIKNGADIVIGSRYTKGGGIKQWPLKRRVLSIGATFLGRILFPDITDPVSGFFAVRKEVVAGAQLHPKGYKFLMEILGKGDWKSFSEIPFIFVDREKGESKLNFQILSEYIKQVIDTAKYSLLYHNNHVWNEWVKMIKFGLVGLSGILVNLSFLYFFTEYLGFYYIIASLIAIEISILSNFFLNDLWTFNPGNKMDSFTQNRFQRLFSFQFISIIGVIINVGILYILTEFFGIYYLISNLGGIVAAFFWNYLLNRHFTWKLINY